MKAAVPRRIGSHHERPWIAGQRDAATHEIATVPTLPRLVEIQRQIASETGCAFFNTFEAMGGRRDDGALVSSQPRLVSSDFMHPLPGGARKVGVLLDQALRVGFLRSKAGRDQPLTHWRSASASSRCRSWRCCYLLILSTRPSKRSTPSDPRRRHTSNAAPHTPALFAFRPAVLFRPPVRDAACAYVSLRTNRPNPAFSKTPRAWCRFSNSFPILRQAVRCTFLHYGDSHTASDDWANRCVRISRAEFGAGGPG